MREKRELKQAKKDARAESRRREAEAPETDPAAADEDGGAAAE
jgi:hypothetical protein